MLDISYLLNSQGDKPSFIIHDNEFKLFDFAFWELKKKTGIYIDPYGKTRIYPEHQQILVHYLSKGKDSVTIRFVNFLQVAIKENEILIADGD